MTSNFRFPQKSPQLLKNSTMVLAAYLSITVLAQGQSSASPEALADQQRIKRMEENLLLNQSIAEAKKLTAAGEYTKAQARYEDILAKTPSVSNGIKIRSEAEKGLAAVYVAQANRLIAQNDYSKARSFMEQAVALVPDNQTYQSSLANIKSKSLTVAERFPTNTVADQNLQDRVNRIRQLFFEGQSYINTGQYSRAQSKYNEVLTIDRYNKVAMKKLKEITLLKRQAAILRKDAMKIKSLADVSEGWDEIRRRRSQEQSDDFRTPPSEPTNVGILYDKLENIRIPELNFTDVDVADVVNYLQEQSKALDETGEGINFVLKSQSTMLPSEDDEDATPIDEPVKTISLDLRDMPLIKVLDFISTLTNLKYEVEEYAVYIFPPNETSKVKVVKSFLVPPTFFSGTSLDEGEGGTDVKGELENRGVKFTAGTSAAYLPNTAKLVVRNTLEQINLIEQLIDEESEETIQISIETKFIEFSEDKLKDFSSNLRISADQNIPAPFNVPVSGFTGNPLQTGGAAFVPPINVDVVNNTTGAAGADGIPDFTTNPGAGNAGKIRAGFGSALRNSGSLSPNRLDALLGLGINRDPALMGFSGVLGSSGFRYLLTAIESTFGGDLMSAPKVTLISGQKSKIRVVREFFYPEEYEPPEVDISSNNSGGASVNLVTVTPSNPTDFVSKDLGVTLDVKANATADRRIDLELVPEVIEFQGFINYGEVVNSASTRTGLVTPITTADNLQPVFSTRKVETKVQVIDGQTVVMAGFIRNDEQEINDKIPFLGDLPLVGRAFRSKSSQSIKRNLMMFVTARMINPDGTPKFLTEEEAEAFGLVTAEE